MLSQDRHITRWGITRSSGKAQGRLGPGCAGSIYSLGGEVVGAVRQQAGDGLGKETALKPQANAGGPESRVCSSIELPVIKGDQWSIAAGGSHVAVHGGRSGLNISSR